ncbi:MAG: type II toxin-antitoxin system RelE/ParE family toxin [Candidatus Omnitrophota bacterium]|nr:type II toxin-antitoxin system RelE/ParE family toxin [Candidatus Omnitrophota bacterium]MDZ4243212.1 type II toxin-antitoxin system RelE/ParE family toxin [Candidatus Omnitrophota bacterium]
MAKYKIEVKKSAAKEIASLPSQVIPKILAKIGSLSDDPHPVDCVKLSGDEMYRIRCGDYRILYSIENDILVVYVVKVGHRRDVYRQK